MITKLEQLAEVLQGSNWADSSLLELSIEQTDLSAFAIKVDLQEALPAWEYLRAKLSETGRWPLLVTCWIPEDNWEDAVQNSNFFSRWAFEQDAWTQPESPISPAAILAEADNIELEDSLKRLAEQHHIEWSKTAESVIEQQADASHLTWFEPYNQHLALLLLPSDQSWAAPAYYNWFGSQNASSALTVAMLKHWHQQWGAELVAHYGTMLQLQVSKMPETAESAITLAQEQAILAPCTLDLPGVSLAEHAAALMQTTRWFLHERP